MTEILLVAVVVGFVAGAVLAARRFHQQLGRMNEAALYRTALLDACQRVSHVRIAAARSLSEINEAERYGMRLYDAVGAVPVDRTWARPYQPLRSYYAGSILEAEGVLDEVGSGVGP